jgi:hypothetical protein
MQTSCLASDMWRFELVGYKPTHEQVALALLALADGVAA